MPFHWVLVEIMLVRNYQQDCHDDQGWLHNVTLAPAKWDLSVVNICIWLKHKVIIIIIFIFHSQLIMFSTYLPVVWSESKKGQNPMHNMGKTLIYQHRTCVPGCKLVIVLWKMILIKSAAHVCYVKQVCFLRLIWSAVSHCQSRNRQNSGLAVNASVTQMFCFKQPNED